MNSNQAKQFPLITIMHKLGYSPEKESHTEAWFRSPFREEAEASFKIHLKDNVWYDFGEGRGGNIIDLFMHLNGHNNVSQALKEIAAVSDAPYNARSQYTPDLFTRRDIPLNNLQRPKTTSQTTPRKPAFQNVEIKPLQNPALLHYLAKRGISHNIGRLYLEEVHYTRQDRPYFALGFKNQKGGYELRNPYFKGCIGKKDITLLKTQENATEKILVFEGFMDFLSYLVYNDITHLDSPVIVINSIALKDKAIEAVKDLEFQEVHLYPDRDSAGQGLTSYFQQQLEGHTIVDQSNLFDGFKDFNAFLSSSNHQSPSSLAR